jgi:hypothetical protein
MFIIHFVLRGFWVGLLGLNSVFPDYGKDTPSYPPLLLQKFAGYLPTMSELIDAIDDLCSTIFAAAFCTLFAYLYMGAAIAVCLFLYNFLSPFVPNIVFFIPIGVVAIIVSSQLVTSLLIRKERYSSSERFVHFHFVMTKVNNLTSLGPFAKPVSQVLMLFSTNYQHKKALVWLVCLFVIIGTLATTLIVGDKRHNVFFLKQHDVYFERMGTYGAHYAINNKDASLLIAPEIQADIIESGVVKLFIPVFNHENAQQKVLCPDLNKQKDSARKLEDGAEFLTYNRLFEQCVAKYLSLKLNGSTVSPNFRIERHPVTLQRGVSTFIDIQQEGENLLQISKSLNQDYQFNWSIPFYSTTEYKRS